MRNEADLLAVRVNKCETARRLGESERQTWKAGTRSDVGDSLSHEVRMNRKAIEQVMRQHCIVTLDRGEVERTVPPAQLIEQRAQPRRISIRERHAQCRGIAHEALE